MARWTFIMLLAGVPAQAELSTVITGIPTTRCVTSADSASCSPVDPAKAQGLRMAIMKDDSNPPNYYWIIDGRPHELGFGGDWGDIATFGDPHGGGLITIMKSKSSPDKGASPKYQYMEVTRIFLTTPPAGSCGPSNAVPFSPDRATRGSRHFHSG